MNDWETGLDLGWNVNRDCWRVIRSDRERERDSCALAKEIKLSTNLNVLFLACPSSSSYLKAVLEL